MKTIPVTYFPGPFRFVSVIIIAHTVAYVISGGISYQFLTKNFWDGPNPLLGVYLRTPGNTDLWNSAMVWQIPAQLLRSLLTGLVLLPLFHFLKEWPVLKRFWFFTALLFVLTHLSSAAPSPANIEGLVYMRPEFTESAFLIMQPEMILYSLVAGWFVARFAYQKNKTKTT